jgi:shikimate kinase
MPRAILIGAPGAGKSSVGRALARELITTFEDTDSKIVEQENRSIADIFSQDGELGFRAIEKKVVLDAISSDFGVISLGGGAVLDSEVQLALKESPAEVIYLKVGLPNVLARIGNRTDRPLVALDPAQQWSELLQIREPIYRLLADHEISTDNKKPFEVAFELMEFVGGNHD